MVGLMSELKKYMRSQILKNRIHNSIRTYERLTGTEAPEAAKKAVITYMERKIDKYIKEDNLITSLIAIATIALLKLRIRGIK